MITQFIQEYNDAFHGLVAVAVFTLPLLIFKKKHNKS